MTTDTPVDTPVYDLMPVPAAAMKNRAPVCEILSHVLPKSGTVLEIGSGSGAHVVYLANHLPHLIFHPTERLDEKLPAIDHWVNIAKLTNIAPASKLDLLEGEWPLEQADALISINVIHIAPWAATLALISKAAKILKSGAPLFFYGPFHRSDMKTVPSNIAFDQSLRMEDPAKGIRHLDDITTHANELGFTGPHIIKMPSNNLSVVFTKT